MFFPSGAVYQDVIEEYNDALAKQRLKCAVHGALESIASTGEAEGHYCELEMALVGLKCSLMLFSRCKPNLIEASPQI